MVIFIIGFLHLILLRNRFNKLIILLLVIFVRTNLSLQSYSEINSKIAKIDHKKEKNDLRYVLKLIKENKILHEIEESKIHKYNELDMIDILTPTHQNLNEKFDFEQLKNTNFFFEKLDSNHKNNLILRKLMSPKR